MKKLKEIIRLENLLYIFIIICPILDMASFIFRNTFNTKISPSTVLRPIIPVIIMIYLFFKQDKKFKIYAILTSAIYLIYGLIHLYLFNFVKTGSSYSTGIHEAQYIVNYTFMILNLFVYLFVFNKKDTSKLKKGILISISIYVISIFMAILTKTSSHTYMEDQMGYKGWFESGNSISAILILSMFIWISCIKDKAYRKIAIPLVILTGILTLTLIGTRVALFGFVLVLFIYAFVEVIFSFLKNKKINTKYIIYGVIGVVLIVSVIGIVGSNTLLRRKHLQEESSKIIDNATQEAASLTGDLLEIKNKIDTNTLEEGFMGPAQKQSIVELYNISKELNLSHTQMRLIQLIYNAILVKNQANFALILFGNGYMTNFYELVLEMEIPAFLFNFGLIGFMLYFVPFLVIFIYAFYKGIRNLKKIDAEYTMLLLGSGFAFILSLLSGYIFFNASTMTILIVIDVMLINKVRIYVKGGLIRN